MTIISSQFIYFYKRKYLYIYLCSYILIYVAYIRKLKVHRERHPHPPLPRFKIWQRMQKWISDFSFWDFFSNIFANIIQKRWTVIPENQLALVSFQNRTGLNARWGVRGKATHKNGRFRRVGPIYNKLLEIFRQ